MSEAFAPVDLAPHNPYSLVLAGPVLVAPGCAVRELDLAGIGAITTRTATLHTRRGAPPRFAATAGGVVFSELPSLGIRTVLKEEAQRWRRSPLPVLLSLLGEASELAELAMMLENVEGIAGLLLSVEGDIVEAVAATRGETQLPFLVTLPYGADRSLLPAQIAQSGADALVVSAPPRAAAGSPQVVHGSWLGPAVFPLTLQALAEVRTVTDVPLIASGGIATAVFARSALDAGAAAVLVDAARWGDPDAPRRIAHALAAQPGAAAGRLP